MIAGVIIGVVLGLVFLGVWGFLFYALFSYFEADTRHQEAQHQLRLTRIRAGLPPS